MRISCKFIFGIIISAITISLVTFRLPCFAYSVYLTWDANAAASLAGCKAYYKDGSTAQPFNGIHGIWGIEGDHSKIVTIPETTPPSVYLTSPDNYSNASGTISVIADGSNRVVKAPNGIINSKDVFPIRSRLSRDSVKSRNQVPEAIGRLIATNSILKIIIVLKNCNIPRIA